MTTPSFTADRAASINAIPADAIIRIAPRAIGHALSAGIAADLLLREGPAGTAFPLWISIAALILTSLAWRARRDVPSEAATWLFVAVLSACGLAWRDSGMLQFLDVCATAGAMGMAAIALANSNAALMAERFRDTLWAGLAGIREVMLGFAPNLVDALREARSHAAWESRSRRTARSGLLAIGVLVVFGALLRGADPIFASLVDIPDFNGSTVVGHLLMAAWFTWLVCGWANAALGSRLAATRAPHRFAIALSVQDLTASLGVLNALFAVFMIAQLGWLFGGDAFLRARTGLTAAEYARHGFFEMVWVVALVVPLLVFTRAALVPGRATARRHTLLSLPLLALLAGIILSAAARMKLYVHYYGLTVDRFYPLVFMGWLIAVLAWFAMTVLRDRGRAFIAGAAISAFSVLIALNVVAPDALVARFNAGRVQNGEAPLGADLHHMSALSGEAIDIALPAILAPPHFAAGVHEREVEDLARCEAAWALLHRWGPGSPAAERAEGDAAWRTWNSGEQRAIGAVSANYVALVKVKASACRGSTSSRHTELAK